MRDTKFENLTSLVLVDTLAALPMEHVVRMASLGHERLRHTASLKWVTDRMTDVTFETILRARQTGGHVEAAFCTQPLMKRLKGRVTLVEYDCTSAYHIDAYVKLAEQVPGSLCFNMSGTTYSGKRRGCLCHELVTAMAMHTSPTYSSVTTKRSCNLDYVIDKVSTMLFEHEHGFVNQQHYICYRPALLNGRHIVDVLRAVCGPADVGEAELDRVRREATEKARNMEDKGWEGMWQTWWKGAAVTADAGAA